MGCGLTQCQFIASKKGELGEKGPENVHLIQKRLQSVMTPGPSVQRHGGEESLFFGGLAPGKMNPVGTGVCVP